MEITCNRCHQAVLAENTYCPACGLPQLQYTAEGAPVSAPIEQGSGVVRDAGSVVWKSALRAALLLALPVGLLCSRISEASDFAVFWMVNASFWAVVLYLRSQRPAWITIGAGARIGLVTGLLVGWVAFTVTGTTLFVERYFLHQSSQIEAEWKIWVDTYSQASQEMTQKWSSGMAAADAAQLQANQAGIHAWMISPWGHAGWVTFSLLFNAFFLLFFAIAGGALAARLMARRRRPEI